MYTYYFVYKILACLKLIYTDYILKWVKERTVGYDKSSLEPIASIKLVCLITMQIINLTISFNSSKLSVSHAFILSIKRISIIQCKFIEWLYNKWCLIKAFVQLLCLFTS